MPLYAFECPKGHVTEKFYGMNDVRPTNVKCVSCPGKANRVYSRPSVVDDFPEHYNISLGEIVKNRAHLKQIQKERGLMDWEPCRNSAGSQLSRERM